MLLAHALGLGLQDVFQASLAILSAAFDPSWGDVELTAESGNRRLSLDDLKDQRRLTPGGPERNLPFHYFTHRRLLRGALHLSRKPVGNYIVIADGNRSVSLIIGNEAGVSSRILRISSVNSDYFDEGA
ncbi:hypothetical protein [Stenotrophomonas maltophilia]|uniref:hypothetical protein n=1 Tax=Stenotrophomonas maltophilia TaxID=40324 RepID=UPI00130449A0|nr:hypothetical protein [Stenotrophomonas maltophilia]MBH1383586.1 hypothetical protein [Stenotrophomonas maltophilia]MBN5103633.1 hypothetical protein [Stenotrophomonas maltophilia]MCF3461039.1 hypothetical protein [Stenotrophomonas maltophilia]MCF3517951.1 hypothetical protein [Stenotrophomonas maltophilia]MCM2519436.1 hypothetical protein [Stenotrophomonas maltophilia]